MLTSLLVLSLSAPAAAPDIPVLIHRTKIDGQQVQRPDLESAVLAEFEARSLTPRVTDGSLEECLQQESLRAPDGCAVLLMNMAGAVADRGVLIIMGAAGDPDNVQLRLLDLQGKKPGKAFMFNTTRDHMSEWFNQIVAPELLELDVAPPPGPAAAAPTKAVVEPDTQSWTTSEKVVVGVGIAEAALGIALSLSILRPTRRTVRLEDTFTLGGEAPPPRFARTFGIPAVPVGVALLLAGGGSAVGTALLRDKENAEWWSLLLSHVISGAALTVTLLLENPPPAAIQL